MQAFAYAAPETVQQALDVLAEHQGAGRRAQVMAGGTDLMVQMRLVDGSPRTIVDIKKIAETNRLDVGAKEVYIGAAIAGAVLSASKPLKACFPGLVESIDLIGSAQIQGRASLGGNLCNASPAGDTISALVANAGVCVIASKGGLREMSVESFVVLSGAGNGLPRAIASERTPRRDYRRGISELGRTGQWFGRRPNSWPGSQAPRRRLAI